jgi:hypothetical protein
MNRFEQAAIGGDEVAGFEKKQVAGDEFGGGDFDGFAAFSARYS